MTIIAKDREWPTYTDINKTTGIPETKRRHFSTLFNDAISEWYRKSGSRPARLVIPIEFKRIIRDQVMQITFGASSGDDDQFYGVPVIWSVGGAMELLGDLPC